MRRAALVAATASALRSSYTAKPPPCDPRTGAALLPYERAGAVRWAKGERRLLSRRPRSDPGRPDMVAWLDTDLEALAEIYAADGVVVREANTTQGAWRLLCMSGTVVQSAALLVDAKIHGGCLAGYTRGLGAAAFACPSSKTALVLGLGFGCVAAFLSAHGPHAVTAVENDPAVMEAARVCAPLAPSVEVVLADAAASVPARKSENVTNEPPRHRPDSVTKPTSRLKFDCHAGSSGAARTTRTT